MSDSMATKTNFSKTLLTGLYYFLMIGVGVFIVVILVNYLESFTIGGTTTSEFALLLAGLVIVFYIASAMQMPLNWDI